MGAPNASLVFATRPGGTTLDRDAEGGNPFATALIRAARSEAAPMATLLPQVRAMTATGSNGHQDPIWVLRAAERAWRLGLPAGERRVALMLVVSDYTLGLRQTLAGAAHDERRVAALFAEYGFSVQQGIAPDRRALCEALRRFATQARTADAALIYSTGHGVSHDGQDYLLPAGYPFTSRDTPASLKRHAIGVHRLAGACQARRANLVFFAACRSALGDAPR
ncbi:MAG TPA: caspase family protein [Burkholderiaceae bacterium]|nr:caspase family protein [Burkholderiaceae bacterium]